MQRQYNWHKVWLIQAMHSSSAVDVFANKKLSTNMNLVLLCNAKKAIVTKKGNLKGYCTVPFHKEGIANLLYLSNVQKKTQGDIR